MKKILIASVCTLGLTLLGAFGNYQNSLTLANELSAGKCTTNVEQYITSNILSCLPGDNSSLAEDAVKQATSNKVKEVQAAINNAKSTAQKSNRNTNESTQVKGVSVNASTTKPNMVYKNVNLSNCKSTKDVVKKLQECGLKGITTSNVNDIKGLKDILTYINENCNNTTQTPDSTPNTSTNKKPDSTTNSTTNKQPDSTTNSTTNKKPDSTTNSTTNKKPASTTNTTTTQKPASTPNTTTTQKPASTPNTSTTTANSSDLSSYADQVLKLVNQERAKAGLPELTTNKTLQAAANKRAQEIVQSFAHTRPDGTSCFTVLKDYGISYKSAGENIAYGQKTPEDVMNAWMNSSGHRANILKSGFGKVGIGVYKVNGVLYWTQLFTN